MISERMTCIEVGSDSRLSHVAEFGFAVTGLESITIPPLRISAFVVCIESGAFSETGIPFTMTAFDSCKFLKYVTVREFM
jgi:hypothetical protein